MDKATGSEPKRPVRRFRLSNSISRLLFIFDVIAVTAAVVMALGIRLDTFDPTVSLIPFLPFALTPILVRPIVMVSFGLHRREWRYASLGEMLDLLNAVAIGSVIILAIYAALSVLEAPSTNPLATSRAYTKSMRWSRSAWLRRTDSPRHALSTSCCTSRLGPPLGVPRHGPKTPPRRIDTVLTP